MGSFHRELMCLNLYSTIFEAGARRERARMQEMPITNLRYLVARTMLSSAAAGEDARGSRRGNGYEAADGHAALVIVRTRPAGGHRHQ